LFFGRENRPPVLSYINDIGVGSGTRTVVPNFYDPDEDIVNVSIVWEDQDSDGFTSPDVLSCPGTNCFASILIKDSEGLNDSQAFKVFIP